MSGGVPAGELLPCPFCGSAADILEHSSEKPPCGEPTGRFFARCGPCDLIIDSAWDVPYEEAVRAWNTRATPTPPPSRDADVERVEKVARVIDPDVWIAFDTDRAFYPADPKERFYAYPRVVASLDKARAALQALGERG